MNSLRLVIIIFLASHTCFAQKYTGIFRLVYDTAKDEYSYVDSKHDTIIPPGKYRICFTQQFKNFAIVSTATNIVGIDRAENILFNVYVFDNGPDYISDGLFMIVKDQKIGYADRNGKIVITPRYDCAYPFKNGQAQVGLGCKTTYSGEHSQWTGGEWQTIDKKGRVINR